MFNLVESGKTQDRFEQLEGNRLETFTPDLQGFKAVHEYIFQDVYEWAGKTRAEEVTIHGETFTPTLYDTWQRKGETNSMSRMAGVETNAYFQGSKTLEAEAPIQINRHVPIFAKASADGKLDIPKFAQLSADMLDDMNFAHPFADGNGRAMRGFLVQLGRSHGIAIDLSTSTKQHWISASILSAEALPNTMISLIEKASTEMTPEQRLNWENSSVKFDPAIRLQEQKGIFDRIKSAIGFDNDIKTAKTVGAVKADSVREDSTVVNALNDSSDSVDLATATATLTLKEEIGRDILESYNSVQNGIAPISSLRETVTKSYQTAVDNKIHDFSFYGKNAPKELGAAAALNGGLTSELMTAQAAVDTINQVQPALRSDKPKDITPEQMQNLKTSSQNNVYGNAFLQAAARVSPTFMRFYSETKNVVGMLVPSVTTDQRLSNEQIDAGLMKVDASKVPSEMLADSIHVIYKNPVEAYKKAVVLASDPNITPSNLRKSIGEKPEILGELKPIKKGMFGRVDERATQSAVIDVKNEAKSLSASLQQGRKVTRKLEEDVSKAISVSIPLPSPKLSEALDRFDKKPDLKNYGKGYDVEKLYTEGQRILEQTGIITKISGKHGFGIKPEALENIKKLKTTVQKLETKLDLKQALTKSLAPKLGPNL